MVRTFNVSNFQQYVERHFLTFVQIIISESTVTRLDLIWDFYPDQSLTQEKRGQHPSFVTRTLFKNKADLFRFIGQ